MAISLEQGFSEVLPFVIHNQNGTVNTTAVLTSTNIDNSAPGSVAAVLDASDNRALIISALGPSGSNIGVTYGGHSKSVLVNVSVPVDRGDVVIGTPGVPYPTP